MFAAVMFVISFHSGHTANVVSSCNAVIRGHTSTQSSGGARIHQYPHWEAGPPQMRYAVC